LLFCLPNFLSFWGVSRYDSNIPERGFYESEGGFYGVWEEIGFREKGVLLPVL
jgi:hypothetical protein